MARNPGRGPRLFFIGIVLARGVASDWRPAGDSSHLLTCGVRLLGARRGTVTI